MKPAFRVKSHLTNEERVILYKLAINRNIVAEIGSYIGASACCFGQAMKESESGKVLCIDTWKNDAMSEGIRDTWQEFQENTKSYKDHIIPIQGYSTEVIKEIENYSKELDVLFIDGDHSYQGVKAD